MQRIVAIFLQLALFASLYFVPAIHNLYGDSWLLFAAWYVGVTLALTYALYIVYGSVMNIQRVRNNGLLTTFGKVLGYPTLIIGLVLDLLVNLLLMTPLMFELPEEFTVTSRLKRHHAESAGWRLAVVKFFEPVLDPLDPRGDHV